jgi:hypothetical protein
MNQISGMLLSSWVNEVLPEMLWATVMLNGLPRKERLLQQISGCAELCKRPCRRVRQNSIYPALLASIRRPLMACFKSLCEAMRPAIKRAITARTLDVLIVELHANRSALALRCNQGLVVPRGTPRTRRAASCNGSSRSRLSN